MFDFDLYNRTTKWAPISPHDEAQRWLKRLIMLLVVFIVNNMWDIAVPNFSVPPRRSLEML
jgi:hypothetical protein